jgi:hypothetical protein
MFDETLLFSLHVFLLGLFFCDWAFAAYNLTSPEELSRLTIPLGCNELPLRLNRMLDNIPVFQKAVQTLHGWNISSNEPFPYSTLLPWIRTLGEIRLANGYGVLCSELGLGRGRTDLGWG